MKRLLILTMIGIMLGGVAGCRFMECLWRGPACQQTSAPVVPACPSPCPTYDSCNSCTSTPAINTPTMPSPDYNAPAAGS
jgi:hypothetical protein